MYKDFFPPIAGPAGHMEPPCPFVGVVTRNERVRPEAVLKVCERYGATSQQSEGLCYWVVFEDEPQRAWSFTKQGLLSSVDSDGYIKCNSYKQDETRPLDPEIPDYMLGSMV